jgi:hypothetical protein
MLIRLGAWSQLGSFTLTRTGRGQERAASPRIFTATTPGAGQLAAADGHRWSWTEVVQRFRGAPGDYRMPWTA